MKGSTTYSFVIVASQGSNSYTSEVQTITTDPVRNGLPPVQLNPANASGVYEGFTVTCQFAMGMGGPSSGSWTFIIDKDGDHVWWHENNTVQDCVRAQMSYDGQHMWIANGNVPGPSNGGLVRVGMDGTGERSYNVPNRHHDIAVLPDEKIAYFEYAGGNAMGCDVVKELDPETEQSATIYEVAQANPGQSGQCHSNAIMWWPDQQIYTLSVMYWNAIIAFDRSGSLSWCVGGACSDYNVGSWSRQHHHHLLENSILLFNNDGDAGNSGRNGSKVIEFEMNPDSGSVLFEYSSGKSTQSMGDAKRLPNGNTLITYSNGGVIQEVDSSGTLVQEITTESLGYSTRRKTLYGPPPPYGE
jgi:hypothetical protein